MSSDQNGALGGGFTIPKKIPKKKRGGDSPGSSLLSTRKVLPTRTSRIADATFTPEWEAMSKLLAQFYARADAAPFREAVNWKALGLFDYPRIIKNPMDLGTVKRKVIEGRYKSVFHAAEDVRLVWNNCMKYNPEGSDYHSLAQRLSKKFEEKYEKLCKKNGVAPSPSKTSRWKSKGSASPGDNNKRKPAAVRRSSSKSENLMPRVSGRNLKRKRNVYKDELKDTDEDDLMTSGEEEALEERRKKRLAWKKKKEGSSVKEEEVANASMEDVNEPEQVIYEIESPPPGQLNCLWYSREPFLHVFVMEKILGWKRRPVTQLESCEPSKTDGDDPKTPLLSAREKLHSINFDESVKMRDNAIVDTGNDFRKRREISRINPGGCPYIKKIAADQELAQSKKEGCDPKFKLVKSNKQEEVFLIKWRGRSYMHCSWERQCDLEKYDQSVQQGAARGKISRFFQSQVISLGNDWKKVLEDGRKAESAPAAHAHHSHHAGKANGDGGNEKKIDEDDTEYVDEEDYFSPLHLEVDRILGCDENELDMKVLARQRALNFRAEREALKKREKEDAEEEKWLKGDGGDSGDSNMANRKQETSSVKDCDEKVEEWDPEDNVRYIVRWKGLQLTEATWEYWIDIKRDFVNEVEDFWLRQKAPSPEEVEEATKESHPHPRSFRKLKESPIFGISNVKRPVAQLGDHEGNKIDADDEPDDGGNVPALKLRTYQLEGVNWLLWNWHNLRSCILADEMGLGKTIQSIGFLHGLQRVPKVNIRGPFLIVAPLSLVSQWESEAREWTPDMNVIVYHGSADARDFLVKNEFYYTDQFETKSNALNLKRKHITKFQLLITTYEVVLKDVNVLSKIRWKALIVDEAHRLKNIKSKLFEDLVSVPRDFCLLLTGTPLQNSTEELWALLHFADPTAFGSREEFTNKFGQLQDADQVANLHRVLRPYLLRRVKEDVEKSLPPKEETILEVTLTPIQKQFYKAIYERNTGFLFKGSKPSNAPSLMNVMMELRKCCNHPFLIRGAEDRIIDDAAETELKALTPKEQIYRQIDYSKLTGEQLVKSSGKFVLLSKLLPKLQSGGHKVLIFSQMVRVLDLLQELLQLNHYRYERLDGTTSASARNSAVDRFKRESFKRFVMLLSTRAGGLGLNLTTADTVIIFDSDWNPQNDLQAMARAHRIGQTRSVRVYRLLTAKTYEMHMFHSASLKLGLDRAVLAHQRQHTNSDEISSKKKRKSKAEREEEAKEIDLLLKKGAYDVFNDDDDKEAHKFMDTDIDQLLEQSSRTVTYGATATNSLSSGLGSFSKASFVAGGEGDGKDVDLDDPDFWSKAVGLEAPAEEVDPTMALIIDDGSKRQRKQVKAFDPLKEDVEAEKRRLEAIARKKQEEKEEKERKRLEKFLRKEAEREAREKAKREEKELKEKLKQKKLKAMKEQKDLKAKEVKKKVKEVKVVYNERKTDRKRALKRAEHEDPIFERVKQAWGSSQRFRTVNAILRFGFGRFCKVRHESNFTSLPIQDVEVFARAYVYQLGLQAATSLLADVDCCEEVGDVNLIVQRSLSRITAASAVEGKDFDWICNAILTSLCMHMRMKSHDAFVRMPITLAEPAFLYDLRQGVAVRSLHRLSFLSRLNSIIEESLDRIIHDVGREAMGQRGCLTDDYSTLDMDLKARYITTEELMYALNVKLSVSLESYRPKCPPWWDRSCDLGLVVGTFFHGLGNYQAMKDDENLPFANKMKYFVMCNSAEAESYGRFEVAADAAKQVFDTALVTMKRKFQEQTQAAVAAVFAASKSGDKKSAYVVKSQEMDDDDIVSLASLKAATVRAFRKPFDTPSKPGKTPSVNYSLPLPDSKHLDHLLVQIVKNIESNSCSLRTPKSHMEEKTSTPAKDLLKQGCSTKQAISINQEVLRKTNASNHTGKTQVIFTGGLSEAEKKPQEDRSDYFLGAASQELASLAVGADSSRYQRGPYVPMIVTRFGLGGILQAEESVIECLVKKTSENLKQNDGSHDQPSTLSGVDKKEDSSSESKKQNSERNMEAEIQPSVKQTMEQQPVETKPSEAQPTELSSAKMQPTEQPSAETQPSAQPSAETQPTEKQSTETQPTEQRSDETQPTEQQSTEQKTPGKQPFTQEPPVKQPLKNQPAWQYIKNDATLRAALCIAMLRGGYPSSAPHDSYLNISAELRLELIRNPALLPPIPFSCLSSPTNMTKCPFFSMEDAFSPVLKSAGIAWPDKKASLHEYFRSVLLPHCLKLCMTLAGEQTKAAKDQGKTDVYLGRPAYESLSPLPDPFVPLEDHSEEAMAYAYAILRRTRLMKSIRFIVGGGIPLKLLTEFLRGPVWRSQAIGIPVWWCPWIHDLGLLVHAALYGLGTIKTMLPLQQSFIKQHVRATFVDGTVGRRPFLPQCFLDQASKEEIDAWVEMHSKQFPTFHVVEHRLALICSLMTVGTEAQYDNVPMFDEGGWPMVEDANAPGILADTRTSGCRCLLSDYER